MTWSLKKQSYRSLMHPGVSYSSSGLQSSSTLAAPMTAIVSDVTIDLKNSERMWKGCMWMFVDACCGSPSKHIVLRKPFLSTEDAVVVTLSPTLSAFSYKSIWIMDVVRRRFRQRMIQLAISSISILHGSGLHLWQDACPQSYVASLTTAANMWSLGLWRVEVKLQWKTRHDLHAIWQWLKSWG